MELSVCREFSFAAAHSLPGYNGPCANLHGHEWVLEVEVIGPVNRETGMVVDFTILKKLVDDTIIKNTDHKHLNDRIPLPTAENMVAIFVDTLYDIVHFNSGVRLQRIRLYENSKSFCEWRRPSNG